MAAAIALGILQKRIFLSICSIQTQIPPPPREIPKPASPRFIAIKLTRNFGHQAALLAGLQYALGKYDCTISIDCDLQQDEEKLKDFIEKFINGADVVLGVRNDR